MARKRKGLLVGIDDDPGNPLYSGLHDSCLHDVDAMERVRCRNDVDLRAPDFACRVLRGAARSRRPVDARRVIDQLEILLRNP